MKSIPDTLPQSAQPQQSSFTPLPRPGFASTVILAVVLACCALLFAGTLFAQQYGVLPRPYFFDQPIYAVGPAESSPAETALLLTAIEASRTADELESAELLDKFADQYEGSVWTPWLRANLGDYYKREGHYTRAVYHWERVWEVTKDSDFGPAKRAADYALAHWTRLLVEMGRLEALGVIFAEHGLRGLDGGPLLQKYLRTMELYGKLQRTPAASYRCGWLVINELSEHWQGRRIDPSRADQLYQEHNLFRSCSMGALAGILRDEQWPMLGVERAAGSAGFPVPSVMHLTLGHYVALLEDQNDRVLVYDPLIGTRALRKEILLRESSGRFLMPVSSVPAGWRQLSAEEMSTTLGRCWLAPAPDDEETECSDSECQTCPTNPSENPKKSNASGADTARSSHPLSRGGGGCSSCGMVHWSVGEPTINLWLKDTPISCQPAYGPPVELRMAYKQRDEYAGSQAYVFNFGPGWNSRWLSYCDARFFIASGCVSGDVYAYLPGGGKIKFTLPTGVRTAKNYYYNATLTAAVTNSTLTSMTLEFPDGRRYVYTYNYSNYMYPETTVDAAGFVTGYTYALEDDVWGVQSLRLKTVTDHTGSLLYTLSYTNGTYTSGNLVSRVTDRFGRTAKITYEDNASGTPVLRSIEDAAGITSTVFYNDSDGYPSQLYTPYGTTTFEYQWLVDREHDYRFIVVTEPNGGRQLFLYNTDSSTLWSGQPGLPATWSSTLMPASGTLPSGTQLDPGASWLMSFHWDQNQSQNVPTNLTQLTVSDLRKARMRHWLTNSETGLIAPDLSISSEVAPSPASDGSVVGQITWFDYAGKPANSPGTRGTQMQPLLVTRKLPDGNTWYVHTMRNSFGLVTNEVSTWGTGSTRTHTYRYDPNNNLDLTSITGPSGLMVSNVYNTRHQRVREIRWADATTAYTNSWGYDSQGRLTGETNATGLITLYSYHLSGASTGYLAAVTNLPIGSYETFTWSNGLIRTHTDARNLARTFTWDGLGRLTQVDYPARSEDALPASSEYYSYSLANGRGFNQSGSPVKILELASFQDRRGKTTYYDRDRLGRLSRLTDPLNHSTIYDYCGCGSPSSVTDARNKTTTFTYNNAGWKTYVSYPDGTYESFAYDALGRMTNRTDALGARYYRYNNQGLLVGVTNSAFATAPEQWITYDIDDQPATVLDGNGVSITQTFDRLGRLLTRAVPGQGTESFQYSARGLTNYTGPDAKVTKYQYDEARRKTREITPKNETNTFGYNLAGDLRTLTDGRNKTTTWTYDAEGLLRAKQYHNQTFTNLTYGYDLERRLAWRKFWSSGVSSAHTAYTHDDAGNLTFINYPMSPDVSYTYNEVNRLATAGVVGLGTNTYTYTDSENLQSEYGLWPSDTVTRYYHRYAPGTRTNLVVTQPSGSWSQFYTNDAAGRLRVVASPAGTFTYTYRGPGTLWTNLALPTSGAITNSYDSGGRLTGTWLKTGTGAITNRHVYAYNATSGRKERHTLNDLSYTTFGYDDDAQLTSALGFTSNNVAVAAEQLGFGYDAGFNMTSRSVNGAPTTYTVNDWNQLNNVGAVTYANDANGNLTTETGGNNRTFTYDDENRLIMVQWGASLYRTEFAYDALSRLRKRTERYYSGGVWTVTGETRYLYDGMQIVQERDGSNVPTVSYTRGKDLSGSLEGAGGIGGMLARSHGYSAGSWSTHSYYHADGMGNITRLVNSTNGVVASYKYDAYGRTISSSGSVVNNFRFSSKLWIYDGTPGFYYFGYRFYEPSLQRWLNRDPLEEQDAPNLYVMVYNNPVNYYDVDGLQASAPPSQPRTPKPKLPTKAPPTPRIPFPKVSLPKPVEKPTIKIGPVGTAIVCGSLIAEAIDVASTIIWPDPDPDPLPVPEKSFKEAKKDCIKECTDETLPTGTLDGAPFFRCMRACMKRAGYNY